MPNDPYYPDAPWSSDTFQDQLTDEYFDSFNPANRFDADPTDRFVPWQTPVPSCAGMYPGARGPVAQGPAAPQQSFEIQEIDSPVVDAAQVDAVQPDEPGRNPSFAPGYPTSYPVDRPTVRPMVQWGDGVYRDMFDPQRALEYWEPRPHPEPIVETSPYMGLAPSSSFSIKGDDCSCDDCRCGGG